jgi:FkbM family methyltransferase
VAIPRFLYNTLSIKRGVGRAVMTIAAHVPALHRLPVRMIDGRILHLDLRESMCMSYLLNGRIVDEPGETQFARSVVLQGETAVDIGANVGWYSTLLCECVGEEGRVYAFEPNGNTLELLNRTSQKYPQLSVVSAALGDAAGEADLHIPIHGEMASLREVVPAFGRTRLKQACRVTTLDAALEPHPLSKVTFVKCDVEGAELSVLKGATNLLNGDRPPIWMIEMNRVTAGQFGYQPGDIIENFRQFAGAGYRAYLIDAATGRLQPVTGPIDTDRCDAAFVPVWLAERVAALVAEGKDPPEAADLVYAR